MIQIENTEKLTVKGTNKVILQRTLNLHRYALNSRKITIEGEYDFSQIPEEDHEIVLQYLMRI